MALIKKFTPQNSDQFLGKDQGDHSLGKFGHLNYILKELNSIPSVTGSPGGIFYANPSGNPITDGNLYWDATNARLGVGTTTPSQKLDVAGDALINGLRLGTGAGISITNTIFGYNTFSINASGLNNVAIGYNALAASTVTNSNVAIGYNALAAHTAAGNGNSVAIGYNALSTKTGLSDSNNVAIGVLAMSDSGGTGGQSNVAIGMQALRNNNGNRNVSVGYQSMRFNTTGAANIAIGYQGLYNTTGTQNIGVGYFAGLGITTGNYNVVIGGTFASSIATLSNNMIFADGQGNERFRVPSTGNFLIGTTTDAGYKLDVNGTVRVQGTELRLDNATTGTINLYSATPRVNFFSGGGYYIGRTSTSLELVSAGNIAFYIGANQGYGLDATNGHLFRSAIAGGASLARLTTGGNFMVGTTTDVASAILQLSSTTKGFLPPVMTGAQVEAIATPAEGLMAYATSAGSGAVTSKGWWGYNGTTWVKLN